MMDISRSISIWTVWMESRGEGEAGMKAVSWAIINRHCSKKWYSGKSLAETCLIPFQFSCWNTRDSNRISLSRMLGDEKIFEDIDDYLSSALNDEENDPIDGATHYIDCSISAPDWALQAKKTTTIGRLTFYKDVK